MTKTTGDTVELFGQPHCEKERSKNKSDIIDFFRLRSNLNLNRAGPGMRESVLCKQRETDE